MNNITLVFPGQGAQYTGMGAGFAKESNKAKQIFEEASDILKVDMKKICFEGSLLELNRLDNMFTGLITTGVAAFQMLQEQTRVDVQAMAGHSLGEYTALACSGALRFDDALRLAQLRGRLAQRTVDDDMGYMTIVDGIELAAIQEICESLSVAGKKVSIASYSSTSQFAVCGDGQSMELAEEQLAKAGATVTPLFFSPPFHSPIMQEIVSEFQEELNKIEYQSFQIPVISNVTAKPYEGKADFYKLPLLQLTEPVMWTQTIDYFKANNIHTIIDMGPQSIMTNLIKQYDPEVSVISFSKKDERELLKKVLPVSSNDSFLEGGKASYNVISRCMAMAVSTRNQNRDEEAYYEEVVVPYNEMAKILEETDKAVRVPSVEEAKLAFQYLKKIFDFKETLVEEQIRRFERIIKEEDKEQRDQLSNYIHELLQV